MPSLYEITESLRGLMARLDDADGEIPPDLTAELDALQMDFENKADNVCRVRVGLVARADGIDTEIKRLTALRDHYTRRADWLKGYLFDAMRKLGIERTATRLFKLWIQKNGRPSVELADATECPEPYRRVTVSFDSQKAYEDWKAGKPLPAGITVTEGCHLRIK